MFNRQGLKRVVKTVRTKRGTKRQVFWVKANADAPKKPGLLRRAAGVAGKGLLAGAALGVAAYGLHKGAKYVHSGKAGEHAALLTKTARQLADGGGRQFLAGRAAHHANTALGHVVSGGNKAGAALHSLAGRAGKHADNFVNRLHNAAKERRTAKPADFASQRRGSFGGQRWGSGAPQAASGFRAGLNHAAGSH